MDRGIIVGCDQMHEQFLPWWWNYYAQGNHLPVCFCDFGMSEDKLKWCQHRGTVIQLPCSVKIRDVSPLKKYLWESAYGDGIWHFRGAWFKKPMALMHSPFDVGLWLDVDCRVRGPLDCVFEELGDKEIGLVRDVKMLIEPEVENYNAGVIVFRKEAKIVQDWAELARHENEEFAGDQNALNHAILRYGADMIVMDDLWNWPMHKGENKDALIWHYTGGKGKCRIIQEIDSQSCKVP